MDLMEVPAEMRDLSRRIDEGVQRLAHEAKHAAASERDYRKAKAEAWVTVRAVASGEKITAAELAARVDGATADLRYERDLAEGMRQAALEALRSRRAQVSALQSLLAAGREEAAFARTGPEMAA